MQSRSAGVRSALASAFSEASFARLAPVSPFATQYRVWMPLRWTIHSSEVSIIRARSSLLTTRAGTWKPVAMNTSDERSEEHTSELQSQSNLVCRLLLEKKKQDNEEIVRSK